MADEKIDVAGIIGPVLGLLDAEPPDVQSHYGGRAGCWQHVPRVNVLERTVVCGRCEVALDPFDVLAKIAHANGNRAYYANETRELARRIEELKAEERRIKARMRNALRKDATEAVNAERARTLESRRRCVEKAKEAARLVDEIRRALGREFDDG